MWETRSSPHGKQLHEVPIRVEHVQLGRPIRSSLGARDDLDVLFSEDADRFGGAGDLECHVPGAADGAFFGDEHGGWSGVLAFEDQVDLRTPRLKPQTRKLEPRTRYFRHAQQVGIKRPRAFQVTDHERDMINLADLQCGHRGTHLKGRAGQGTGLLKRNQAPGGGAKLGPCGQW